MLEIPVFTVEIFSGAAKLDMSTSVARVPPDSPTSIRLPAMEMAPISLRPVAQIARSTGLAGLAMS